MLATCEDYFELIETEGARDPFDDLKLARDEFHNLTGKFEDGEPWFEQRMTMFLDWYLLERPGRDGRTPVERILARGELRQEELNELRHFTCSMRSVFQIKEIKGELITIEDLVRGGLWLARTTISAVGLNRGDIMGARLVFFAGSPTLLVKSLVLHQPEAHEAILGIISKGKSEKAPSAYLVNQLDMMRLKMDRYSNVRIQHVYRYPGDALV